MGGGGVKSGCVVLGDFVLRCKQRGEGSVRHMSYLSPYGVHYCGVLGSTKIVLGTRKSSERKRERPQSNPAAFSAFLTLTLTIRKSTYCTA